MSSKDVQEAVRQHKMRKYVMDPTFPQPYAMDHVKFKMKIKENLFILNLTFLIVKKPSVTLFKKENWRIQ